MKLFDFFVQELSLGELSVDCFLETWARGFCSIKQHDGFLEVMAQLVGIGQSLIV